MEEVSVNGSYYIQKVHEDIRTGVNPSIVGVLVVSYEQ